MIWGNLGNSESPLSQCERSICKHRAYHSSLCQAIESREREQLEAYSSTWLTQSSYSFFVYSLGGVWLRDYNLKS